MPTDLFKNASIIKRKVGPSHVDGYLAVIIAILVVPLLWVATMQLSLTDAQDAGASSAATVLVGP